MARDADDSPSHTTQTWDPERYARNARFVADLGQDLVDLLAPAPGERVLDLGCGDGALTERLVAAGARVVGIDGSAPQVNAARARGLDARVGDGEALAFEAEFDAVFSNAALHWMKRPERVLDGVFRALVPGGRFVGELGGEGCVHKIVSALGDALRARGIDPAPHHPWYFPGVTEYRERLERAGFQVSTIRLFDRPTPLPGDVTGWFETFAESFARPIAPAERNAFHAEVRERLRPTLCDADGRWTADYVRLRFRAEKPAE